MLITKKNLDFFLKQITQASVIGYDTETTSLSWFESPWHDIKPRIFAAQFASDQGNFYLDFEHDPDKLDDSAWGILQRELFSDPSKTWAIQNAKFDMHQSANYGVNFEGIVHCTKAVARIVDNNEPSLTLDDLAQKYLGAEKLDVKSYIAEHKLFTKIRRFGVREEFIEFPHYEKVPLKLMYDYGIRDTELCLKLYRYQMQRLEKIEAEIKTNPSPERFGNRSIYAVLENERKLTKLFYEMERRGIKLDVPFTEKAYENEVTEYRKVEAELDAIAAPHVDKKMNWLAPKELVKIFTALNEPYTFTEKGNACFDSDALEASDASVAKLILKYRYHYKRAHTYFENYLWMRDKQDVIHPDAQQAGTSTGRTSYWTPNLQNVPKRGDKQEDHFRVRRCFIPREGYFFYEPDYTGAEYYQAVDYADEMPTIELIKNGDDPHESLGDSMGLERDPAKTMQFRILYGGGNGVVGKALGEKDPYKAKALGKIKKAEYFSRMPNLAAFLKLVSNTAAKRGYVINFLGRLLRYDSTTAYKAPNGLIQGNVGDMTKVAQVRIRERVMPSYNAYMLLQVHDAILFEIPYGEEEIIPKIDAEMRAVYPYKHLPMKVEGQFSKISWSDLQDEIPTP